MRERWATSRLTGHPNRFQLERSGTRIFVNVPPPPCSHRGRRARAVTLSGHYRDSGRTFPWRSTKTSTALRGCVSRAIAVIDTNSGKIVAQLDCVGDTDDLFYDAALRRPRFRRRGFLSVFQEAGSQSLHLSSENSNGWGARTSLFVPNLKAVFISLCRIVMRRPRRSVYTKRNRKLTL